MLYIKGYSHQGARNSLVKESKVITVFQILNHITLISDQIFHFLKLAAEQFSFNRLRKALNIVLEKEGFNYGSKRCRWF